MWGAKLTLQEVGQLAFPWAFRILGGQPCNNAPSQAGGSTLLHLVGALDGLRLMLNVEIVTQSWVSHLLAFNTSLVFNKKQHYFGAVNLYFTIWHTLMPLMFLLLTGKNHHGTISSLPTRISLHI